MKKKFSTMKLQNRFLLILLLALTISATLFELLWLNKWALVNWTGNFEILQSQIDDEDFWTKLDETAQNLSLPESSDDEAAAKAIKPLLDLADKYTSIFTNRRMAFILQDNMQKLWTKSIPVSGLFSILDTG